MLTVSYGDSQFLPLASHIFSHSSAMTILILWGFCLYRKIILKNLAKYFYWHFWVKYGTKIQAIFSCHGTLPGSNRDKIAIEFNYGIFSFEVSYFKLVCHFLAKNVLQFPIFPNSKHFIWKRSAKKLFPSAFSRHRVWKWLIFFSHAYISNFKPSAPWFTCMIFFSFFQSLPCTNLPLFYNMIWLFKLCDQASHFVTFVESVY